MNSTIRSTLIGLAAAGALLPALAAAEAMDGYLTDKGGAVVKAPRAGVCVRTRQWTPALAIAECDPDLVKKPMAAPRAEPMRPAPKKAAKKKKKAKPMNVRQGPNDG
jgi:OOP family OmpA-OmpF porin